MSQPVNNLLGLDIGTKRIGVARVNIVAKIPEPLITLENNSSFKIELNQLIDAHKIDKIVVGLPRSLNGNETEQSRFIRGFVDDNLKDYDVIWQDETLSTVVAASRMKEFGVSDKPIMLDAVAACIILEDYLESCR